MTKPKVCAHRALLMVLILLAGCGTQPALPERESEYDSAARTVEANESPLRVLLDALESEGYTPDSDKISSVESDGITITTVPLEGTASSVTYFSEETRVVTAQYSAFTRAGVPVSDWPVCHVPPGNPAASRTLYLGHAAIEAHVGNHGGDTLGYCPADMAADPELEILAVILSEGLPPFVTRASYDEDGEVVLRENGEAVGVESLTDLTTIKPDEPVHPEDTAMFDFAEFLSETLGAEAAPFLEAIPVSMGGTGPELDPEADGLGSRLSNLVDTLRDVKCFPGECPDEEGPSDGDPEAPGEDPDAPGDEEPPSGEEPPADESPSDGDPGDGGTSYDPAEFERLTGIVEHWEAGVGEIESVIAGFDAELDAAKERRDKYLETLERIVIASEPRLAEIEDDIRELGDDIEKVDGDLDGDRVGIALGAIGVVGTCAGTVTGWGVFLCPVSAGALNHTLESYKGHAAEKDEYVQERDELIMERDGLIGEAEEAASGAAHVRDEIIEPLEGDIAAAEGLLELAQQELAEAEEDLARFKERNGID